MTKKLLHVHTLTLVLGILGLALPAQAAVLTFETGSITNNAFGDSVLNDGDFVLGVNVGAADNATVNSVVFTGQNSTSINYTDNGVTFESTATLSTGLTGSPGYTNAGLNTMLDSAQLTNNVGNGSDSVAFSFSGLTIGTFYRVQILSFQVGTAGVSGGRNSVLFNGSDALNFSDTVAPTDTTGAFVIATWQADATTQTFLLTPEVTDPAVNRRAALDGISLFVVPEPNSMALLGAASGLLFLRRRRR